MAKDLPVNQILIGDWIERLRGIPNSTYHAVICSPPYWGQRDYGWGGDGSCYDKKRKMDIHKRYKDAGAIEICEKCGRKRPKFGLEKTPEEHIEKLVEGFREVRRVLRDDGQVFINYGDKYATTPPGKNPGGFQGSKMKEKHDYNVAYPRERKYSNLDNGNILMLPARVALALQADGWILRDDIIWMKACSFCDTYSGSCMPESVNGWRWERCRKRTWPDADVNKTKELRRDKQQGRNFGKPIVKDCPGCEKCNPNGGYVLRKGSWRCTKAHEHIFQFVKQIPYYADMEAVKEDSECMGRESKRPQTHRTDNINLVKKDFLTNPEREYPPSRNLRNVWAINPRGYKDAHYATFPEDLVEPMIKVATSQKGVCPKCGSQWARIVDNKHVKRKRPKDRTF